MLVRLWNSLAILSLVCLLVGCGKSGSSAPSTNPSPNPVPAVSSISPSTALVGGSATTLSIAGSGFISTSQVFWNGSALPTTYVSSTSLTAQVPASDLATTGTVNISVQTAAPGGGTSSALIFTINNPAPTLASLSPANATADGLPFALTVTGTEFVPSSQILWNGAPLKTTYVSGTSLTAQVPASDIPQVGNASITVQTPSPGGGTSSALTFTIGASATNLIVVPLKGSDLAWDATHGKLYVAVPSSAGSNANTISVVDPVTGTITGSQQLSTSPSGLAVSGDGQFLYAVINGANSIQRFILPALTPDIQWSLGAASGSNLLINEVQVEPGAPHTVAVSMQGQYGTNSIAVFDDGVERPQAAAGAAGNILGSSLQWKSDGTALYSALTMLTDSGSFSSATDLALYTMPVTSSGVGVVTAYSSAFRREGTRLLYDPATGYVYSSWGQAINPANGTSAGWFRESRSPGTIAPGALAVVDSNLGRFYKLEEFQQANGPLAFRIQAFDQKQLQLLGSVVIPNPVGTPTAFVRWGQSGLAFTTTVNGSATGNLYIVDGSFVNPAGTPDTTAGAPLLPVPVLTDLSPLTATSGTGALTLTVSGRGFAGNPTVYWNGTALPTSVVSSTQVSVQIPASDLASAGLAAITVSNSGSSLPASNSLPFPVNDAPPVGNQISVFNIGGNNLAWDATSAKLYVSVPGVQGDKGDAIAIVDPATGTVSSTGFLGSEPDRLSISDGGQYLYVGLDAQNSIQQLSLPALTANSSWNLGGETVFGGPYYALDLRAAPGAANTTAVTLAQFGISPSSQGVVIYDGTTPRAPLQNGAYTYFGLEWGSSSSVLYAFDQGIPESLLTLNVSSSGASLGQHFDRMVTPFSNGMHFDSGTGLLYTDGGQAIQPSNGSIVGTYNASGLAVPDSSLDRVFILGQTAAQAKTSNYTIESFDQTAFTPVSSITVENVVGTPTAFVRWGTNGLAFTTRVGSPWDFTGIGPGQLYVVSGDFVQSSPSSHVSPARPQPVQNAW